MASDLELLMTRVGDVGATIILKVDGERGPGDAGRWTFVVSGGTLAEEGPVRVDAASLNECLARGLALLKGREGEWAWLDEFEVG